MKNSIDTCFTNLMLIQTRLGYERELELQEARRAAVASIPETIKELGKYGLNFNEGSEEGKRRYKSALFSFNSHFFDRTTVSSISVSRESRSFSGLAFS